jgi:arabinogalactan endo-1,4-beta-galactosidase
MFTMRPTRCNKAVVLSAAIFAASVARADPFYMGSDVSLLPTIEQLSGDPAGGASGPFKDGGVTRPGEQILVNHGDNLFRIRLFVNPPSTTYTNANAGAIQDQAYAIALAQRLKATGAKILLDLHYSDTWADPGHQTKPAAWNSLTMSQLVTQVHDYTDSTITAFENAGVEPDMVQVGNEISNGMLWNNGSLNFTGTTAQQQTSWQNLGSLLNSAIKGVRDAQGTGPKINVAIHIDQGDQDGHPQFYFGDLTKSTWGNVTDFDTIGVSYYPSTRASHSFALLQSNLTTMANTYAGKKIMVLETNYPWRTNTSLTVPNWPATQAGQQQFLTDLRNMVQGLPGGAGEGVVWWYPESIQVPNYTIYNGGDTALFDASGNALPAVNAFSISSPTWSVDADGTWYNASDWTGGVPMFAGNVANFGSAITAPRTVTMNNAESVSTINFSSSISYTIVGPSTLTMSATSGQAAINVTAGSHTISAPMSLASDTNVTVTPAASSLIVTGALSASSRLLTKSGAGLLQLENLRAGTLNLSAGTLRISQKTQPMSSTGTSVIGSTTFTSGATLDLTNNAMIVNDPSSLTAIAVLIADGGITSSTAAAVAADSSNPHKAALGYARAGDLGITTFAGQSVVASDTIVGYVLAGDANLDGTVDTSDFDALAANFNTLSNTGWSLGDFNHDGVINSLDFNALASNFGQTLAPVSPGALVPEPVGVVLAMAGFALLRRKRAISSERCWPAASSALDAITNTQSGH